MPVLVKVAHQSLAETFTGVDCVSALEQYLQEYFTPSRLCKDLLQEQVRFVAVVSHAKTVAYMKLNTGKALTNDLFRGGLEIQYLYVLKAFRGQQIGQALVEDAIAYAKAYGLPCVWVRVWQGDKEGLDFYDRMGFKQAADCPSFIEGEKDFLLQLAC